MGQDVTVCIGVKTDQVAPFLGGIDIVRHDLAVGHGREAVEDLDRLSASTLRDVKMVDRCGADEGELVIGDPSPEDALLVHGGRHEL